MIRRSFAKIRKSYQLLQEYFNGLSKETLRELLCFQDKWIRQSALWITSELGRDSGDLLKEVVTQINDDDPYICFWALEIVAHFASGEYIDYFMKVFSFLEHFNQEIRASVMLIISGLSNPRIHEAAAKLTKCRQLPLLQYTTQEP